MLKNQFKIHVGNQNFDLLEVKTLTAKKEH